MTENSAIYPMLRVMRQRFIRNGMRLLRVAAGGLCFVLLVAVSSTARGQAPAIPDTGGLDCNGLSPLQKPTIAALRHVCLDVAPRLGEDRAEDNGTYIGHDEPMVTFYSGVPGSGNNVQWEFTLPRENPLPATQSFQNFITFWFGMALCDPKSVPFGPCVPNSDLNDPNNAGSAVLELQFYPPGNALLPREFSCDLVHWCAALNINSLTNNKNCFEPINFALIQRDGVPSGPPGPGNQTPAAFTPDAQTLIMRQGDRIRVTIKDTANGLLTLVEDLTTHQSGFMVASAANGFQNTDSVTCATTAFSFHPEYNTATADHIVPWTLARNNISFAMEIGHFEPQDADADDTICFPVSPVTGPVVAGCFNSDSDFDGTSYLPDWPDGTRANATSVGIRSSRGHGIGPLSASMDHRGRDIYVNPFATFQFETGASAKDLTCINSSNCVVPPQGAAFYPFFALRTGDPGFRKRGREDNEAEQCVLIFGNFSGQAINNFGGDAQYGSPDVTRFFQEHVSAVQLNPCLPRIDGDDRNERSDRNERGNGNERDDRNERHDR
jgi:hypothetical protein